jgi:hypothetical protein
MPPRERCAMRAPYCHATIFIIDFLPFAELILPSLRYGAAAGRHAYDSFSAPLFHVFGQMPRFRCRRHRFFR